MDIRKSTTNANNDLANKLASGLERSAKMREQLAEQTRRMADHAAEAASSGDRVDLSTPAQELQAQDEASAARSERVSELKAAYEEGRLNTPERIEDAARGILLEGRDL